MSAITVSMNSKNIFIIIYFLHEKRNKQNKKIKWYELFNHIYYQKLFMNISWILELSSDYIIIMLIIMCINKKLFKNILLTI